MFMSNAPYRSYNSYKTVTHYLVGEKYWKRIKQN